MADLTECEKAQQHLPGTGHTYMECPTTSDQYHDEQES